MAKQHTQTARPMAIATPLEGDELLIRSFEAAESLGRPFRYELDLRSSSACVDFGKILGQNVTIRVEVEGGTRYFNGYVSSFSQGDGEGGMATYEATVVPWLWFLTRRADCRIFQGLSVPDIIKKVFRDAGYSDFTEDLQGSYSAWDYCVQYRETDFNFVSRLMEHEGIYYFFTHEDGKHTMHLCDSPNGHEAYPGYDKLPFREGLSVDTEAVWSWQLEQEYQPAKYALGDFDYSRPSADLAARKAQEGSSNPHEIFDFPGEYEEQSDGETYAKLRLEELHAEAVRATGQTAARGLGVGHIFELTGHPREDQNRKFLVTSRVHVYRADPFETGDADTPTDSCRFTAIPADKQFRPERTTPKPLIQGPQTAIVVGKSGEEIWTDELGRVKLQFHWDGACGGDEKSSCWVRVSQAVAGKGWGHIFLPRIGHEVIVEFLEGDPDRPIVTGRVYNGTNKPPYPLPAEATKSTLKSDSSKGSEGFNEIRFEDKKGDEQVFIHAQKNQDIVVENDETHKVGHDRSKDVGNDERVSIGNDRTEKVGHDESITIDNDRRERVGGNESITIAKNRSENVAGDETIMVDGKRSEEVGKDENIKVNGQRTTSVGKDEGLSVSGGRSVSVGKSDSLNVSKELTVEAGDQIVLKTGSASITMKKNGDIIIDGKNLSIKGSGKIVVEASSDMKLKGSKITQN